MASIVLNARNPVAWIQKVRRRTSRLPWISLTVVTILLLCAAFAPLLAPHDPELISMLDAKLAPGEDMRYPLGTDVMGRDMLSRLIFGGRTSVLISFVALGAGALVGTVLGLIAGYRGGWVDALTMRAAVLRWGSLPSS